MLSMNIATPRSPSIGWNKLVLLLLISCATLAASSQETTGTSPSRGDQYCEILSGGLTSIRVTWNGTGGMCHSNPGFYNVTGKDVRRVHGFIQTPLVKYNGVRQWTVDAVIRQDQGDDTTKAGLPVFEYGNMFPDGSGLRMVQVATINNIDNPLKRLVSTQTYQASAVKRHTTMLWKAGGTVYELVAPGCTAIYAMQSFMIGRPGAWGVEGGEVELATLQEMGRIQPPAGWTYRTRVLGDDLVVLGDGGVTMVLQDELENSYSKLDEPFDPSLCPL